MLMAPEKIADVTRHLLRTNLSGRSGPIHLSLPADMMGRPVTDDLRKPPSTAPHRNFRPPLGQGSGQAPLAGPAPGGVGGPTAFICRALTTSCAIW